ncbi:ribonuclease-3 family protein [Marinitoga hydrogenitolerans DSM 16785]|uniref:Mini-ribonuclease 3 n=1 Tax=Marinitoga hydrogenitolerans (strain DSM 16785 / JCM 12826 / AT1271) TaxID=1122195 RepID=A0A1M4WUZ3_MARH1|nr:ribonuclease III domain-containing protein [Marinitoga hydrogenitolerans]SHE84987.1 ribonuclease-3 family protein [Marinitoga hydrogenitolerans DSM 16785]
MSEFNNLGKLFESKIKDLREVPVDTFAYIGDAVINLYFINYIIDTGRKKAGKLHNESKNYVSAKAQAKIVDNILNSFNEEEKNIYKRGLNSKGAKKRGNDLEYRKATAFETVIGYLFLKKDYSRLNEILESSKNVLGERK